MVRILSFSFFHFIAISRRILDKCSDSNEHDGELLILQIQIERQVQRLATQSNVTLHRTRFADWVAALNFYNAETLLAHVGAVDARQALIFSQTPEWTINYFDLPLIVAPAIYGLRQVAAKIQSSERAFQILNAGTYPGSFEEFHGPATESKAMARLQRSQGLARRVMDSNFPNRRRL